MSVQGSKIVGKRAMRLRQGVFVVCHVCDEFDEFDEARYL
jgi:hypothetical protein